MTGQWVTCHGGFEVLNGPPSRLAAVRSGPMIVELTRLAEADLFDAAAASLLVSRAGLQRCPRSARRPLLLR